MKYLIVYILGYLVIFGTQYLYEDSLFELSGTFIPQIQNNMKVWKIYTDLGGAVIQIVIMAYLAIFEKYNIESLIFVLNFVLQVFLIFILKMFHHQARPFWVYSQITAGTCYTEFGNPSGHSICATYFANYFYFIYIRGDDSTQIQYTHSAIVDVERNSQRSDQQNDQFRQLDVESHSKVVLKLREIRSKLSNTQKVFCFLILNFLSLLMVFSRLAIGVHSINQVLYGSLLGYWTAIFVIVYLRPFLVDNIQQITERQLSSKTAKYYVLMAFIIFFNAWTVNFWIMLYLERIQAFDIDFTNINKCLEEKGKAIKTQDDVKIENFRVCGIILFGFSSYAGTVFREYVIRDEDHVKNQQQTNQFWNLLVLKGAIVAVPCGISFAMSQFITQGGVFFEMIFMTAIPFMIIGFTLFSSIETKLLPKSKDRSPNQIQMNQNELSV